MTFKYLASPYSSPDPQVRQARYRAAMMATSWLLIRRVWTYSPIVHCHAMAEEFGLPTDAQYWQDYNFAMIERAEGLLVLTLDGWRDSKGVAGEVEFAQTNRTEVRWLRPRPDTFPPAYEFSVKPPK